MLEYQKTHGTVYVVDDDEAIRDSICWLLEASDYNVELYVQNPSFFAVAYKFSAGTSLEEGPWH